MFELILMIVMAVGVLLLVRFEPIKFNKIPDTNAVNDFDSFYNQ